MSLDGTHMTGGCTQRNIGVHSHRIVFFVGLLRMHFSRYKHQHARKLQENILTRTSISAPLPSHRLDWLNQMCSSPKNVAWHSVNIHALRLPHGAQPLEEICNYQQVLEKGHSAPSRNKRLTERPRHRKDSPLRGNLQNSACTMRLSTDAVVIPQSWSAAAIRCANIHEAHSRNMEHRTAPTVDSLPVNMETQPSKAK